MNATHALNSRSSKPVWFLDVDGVINSYPEPKPHMINRFGPYTKVNVGPCSDNVVYRIWYSPRVIDFLNRINGDGIVEIVWLTTWVEEAVTLFAPRVGLDTFPVITDMDGGERCWETDWWKYRRVRDFLGDNEEARPVIWTDDDLSRQVKNDFRFRYSHARSHLLTAQPCPGLQPKDMDAIERFARGIDAK